MRYFSVYDKAGYFRGNFAANLKKSIEDHIKAEYKMEDVSSFRVEPMLRFIRGTAGYIRFVS